MPFNILLVDDSPTVLNLLSMGLRQQGYVVLTANDGLEAMTKVTSGKVDLVITDVNMPRMDGYALTRALRSRKPYSDIPIIMLSTESSEADKTKGMDSGVDEYLTKPIDSSELLRQVRRFIG